MNWSIFTHEYFWLSFLPISALGAGFWLLLFDRADQKQEPGLKLIMALIAGSFSAAAFGFIATKVSLENEFLKIFGEEFFKILFAILIMEIFRRRFTSPADGLIYGFSIGLGFAMFENLFYLVSVFELAEFGDTFWLTFQGRFWTSLLLHGVTTAIFGLFYASAFLFATVHKEQRESPLRVFFIPPNWKQFLQILTLHVTRRHILFANQKTIRGHFARAVLMEGLICAVIFHTIFNLALNYSHPEISFFMAIGGLLFCVNKAREIGKD